MNYTIASLVNELFNIYNFLVLIWCILSWIPSNSSVVGDLKSVIGTLVNPWLSLFRRLIPPLGGVDFSPIVALLVLDGLRRVVVNLLV